ncbi:MAG TPA: FkbM family methyltransferase [Gemmataceae bacterium]
MVGEVDLPLRARLTGPLLRRLRPAVLAAQLKRLLCIPRVLVATPAGSFAVDPISLLGDQLIRERCYEPATVAALERHLSPGAVFVDVGANEGYFTVLGGKLVGPAGRVVAVEPQARSREVLAENLRLNDLHNVAVCAAAVSDTEGTAELYLTPDVNTGGSGLARKNRYPLPTETVRTTTLARLLADAGVGAVDLMKLDIEGFEYEAVFGSKDLFRSGAVRALALELHPDVLRGRGRDPDELVEFLRGCGYREDRSTGNVVFVRGAG